MIAQVADAMVYEVVSREQPLSDLLKLLHQAMELQEVCQAHISSQLSCQSSLVLMPCLPKLTLHGHKSHQARAESKQTYSCEIKLQSVCINNKPKP